MSDAQRYRERAAQAERLARQMTNAQQRDQLLGIAGDWRLLAERVEALEGAETDKAEVLVDFQSGLRLDSSNRPPP